MRVETAILWALALDIILMARVLWHAAPAIRNSFILAETQAQLSLVLRELEKVRNENARLAGADGGGDSGGSVDGVPEEAAAPAA